MRIILIVSFLLGSFSSFAYIGFDFPVKVSVSISGRKCEDMAYFVKKNFSQNGNFTKGHSLNSNSCKIKTYQMKNGGTQNVLETKLSWRD